jgi:hypothetical protein
MSVVTQSTLFTLKQLASAVSTFASEDVVGVARTLELESSLIPNGRRHIQYT